MLDDAAACERRGLVAAASSPQEATRRGAPARLRITSSSDFPLLTGRTIDEIAAEQDRSELAVICDLLATATAPIGVALETASGNPVRDLPSDSAADPRASGLFPRVLQRYARGSRLTTFEDAVRLMTSVPADLIGIGDRGRIAVSQRADLVVLDTETIADRSTWWDPLLAPEGIEHVFVNGQLALRDGAATGVLSGRFVHPDPNSSR